MTAVLGETKNFEPQVKVALNDQQGPRYNFLPEGAMDKLGDTQSNSVINKDRDTILYLRRPWTNWVIGKAIYNLEGGLGVFP